MLVHSWICLRKQCPAVSEKDLAFSKMKPNICDPFFQRFVYNLGSYGLGAESSRQDEDIEGSVERPMVGFSLFM